MDILHLLLVLNFPLIFKVVIPIPILIILIIINYFHHFHYHFHTLILILIHNLLPYPDPLVIS